MYTIKSPLSQSQRGENTCTCDLHILVLHFIVVKSLTHFFSHLQFTVFSVWTRLNSTHQKSVQLVSSWCILWVSELFLFVLYSSSFAFRSVQTTNCKMCATRTYLRVYASNAVCKKDLLSESNEDTRHCLNAVHPDCSAHRGNCFVMT